MTCSAAAASAFAFASAFDAVAASAFAFASAIIGASTLDDSSCASFNSNAALATSAFATSAFALIISASLLFFFSSVSLILPANFICNCAFSPNFSTKCCNSSCVSFIFLSFVFLISVAFNSSS